MRPGDGKIEPRVSAMTTFTGPATAPLMAAVWTGSPADTFRVRLLSIPQQRQAAIMAIGPRRPSVVACPVDHESRQVPAVISTIPSAMRRSKFSWKANHASSAVKTPSIFKSNEAVDAAVRARPIIRSSGPSTPPKRTAPANQGTSERVSEDSADDTPVSRRKRIQRPSPSPEPMYKSPARRAGWMSPTNIFAKKVLEPNRAAEASALATPARITG